MAVTNFNPCVGFITTDFVRDQNQDWVVPLIPNGCAWYRQHLPGMELSKRGWEVHHGLSVFDDSAGFAIVKEPPKADNVAMEVTGNFPIVCFKLTMNRGTLDCIDRAKELGQKIVVDIDDFFPEIPVTNIAYERSDPEKYPDNNRDILHEIAMKADWIITSTQFLYDYYAPLHPRVRLMRNYIDHERFVGNYRRNKARCKKMGRKPKIGWVGMTPWRGGDLETLDWLNHYLMFNDLRFHHSGHSPDMPPAWQAMKLDPNRVDFNMQAPIPWLYELFKYIDIGLVPLVHSRFNSAKSYLKGLEYAVNGIPFVADSLPEYEYFFDGGVGRIANNAKDWQFHLSELLDPDMRFEEIDFNYENVMDRFIISKHGQEWHEVYMEILESDHLS